MKRPKQRNTPKPNYRLRIDRRKLFPHLPRDLIYKAMPDYARPVIGEYAPGGLRIDEEGQVKGAHNGTETKTKAER